jgi:hypothetical protein
MIESYEKDIRAYRDDALRMSWFMRGGLQYDDALLLSIPEKEIINAIIKDNMKTTKESGLPFF